MQTHREDGAAVILAVMASGLLLGAGTAIVLTTTVETSIASAFRGGVKRQKSARSSAFRPLTGNGPGAGSSLRGCLTDGRE